MSKTTDKSASEKLATKFTRDVRAGDTVSLRIDRDYIASLKDSGIFENRIAAWLLRLRLGLRRKFCLDVKVVGASLDCLYLRSFWLVSRGDFYEYRQDVAAQKFVR